MFFQCGHALLLVKHVGIDLITEGKYAFLKLVVFLFHFPTFDGDVNKEKNLLSCKSCLKGSTTSPLAVLEGCANSCGGGGANRHALCLEGAAPCDGQGKLVLYAITHPVFNCW